MEKRSDPTTMTTNNVSALTGGTLKPGTITALVDIAERSGNLFNLLADKLQP